MTLSTKSVKSNPLAPQLLFLQPGERTKVYFRFCNDVLENFLL